MARKHWWAEYSAEDFEKLDFDRAVAVLPLAATEQHGPHLPVSTDANIMDGMLARVTKSLQDKAQICIFPVERIGASDEHCRFEGTQTISSQEMIEKIVARGQEAHRVGFKKLVLVNSHGGNEPAMAIAALELRKRNNMLVVKTSWGRFGVPVGLFTDEELKIGIHGGDYETSLMLAFRPEAVAMDKAANFESATSRAKATFKHLSPQSPHSFAWLAGDLNPQGVVGNAAAATVQKGEMVAAHQTDGFVDLLREIAEARLDDWIK